MSFQITTTPDCATLQFVETTGIYGATADTVYEVDPLNGSGYNGTGVANVALNDVASATLSYVMGDGTTTGIVFQGTQWLPGMAGHAYLRISAIAGSNSLMVAIDGDNLFALAMTGLSTDVDSACAAIIDNINAYVTTGVQWQAEYLGSGIIHVWTLSLSGDLADGLTVTVTQTGVTHTSDSTTTGSGNGTGMTYAMGPLSDGMYTFQLDLYDSSAVLLSTVQFEYLHTCNVEKCLAEAIFRKAKSDCGCGGGCSGCAGADKLTWVFAQLWAVKKMHANGIFSCVHDITTGLLAQCQNLCKDC